MTETTLLRREDAPLESTWNREAVYPSWADWDADYELALAELPALRAFAGRLGEGPAVLLDWLRTAGLHWQRIMKLYFFARMAAWVETTDQAATSRFSQATALQGKFEAASALAEVELMQLGETLLAWADAEPQLAAYQQYFANLLRQQGHQRSAEVEELLGLLADPFSGASVTYRELTNNDLQVADAVDSQGRRHPVRDAAPAPTGIQSADREHRRTAWQNFADSHLARQNSLASTYLTVVKQHVFLAKVRGYNSVLEMMLAPSNLPVAVFHNVINTFERELPLWHRYWAAKRKALGVDSLHPYDIYAPLMEPAPYVPYRQAVDWIGQALQPLGEPYVNALQRGVLEERWVDYAPTAGKMGGAAATPFGVIPPFIYMSYDESLMSASVLAHELGHSMHFHFNTELQPHVYRNYQIMSASVVETASNFHQAMLRAYLQDAKQTDRSFTLALIDEAMFNFHRYFFIMPTLARFELTVYSRVEAGQSLTVNDLNQTMADLFAEGYGDTLADDPTRTAITWAQFMHLFYLPFYAFQYAVGLSAAQALAARVLSGAEGAVANYLAFLQAAASRYPLDLFKLAGVDMTSPEPVEQAFAALAGFVDRLEELTR